MPAKQRIEYTKAVVCLQSLPPKSPRNLYPGALNRYDDFVATHETMALELHSQVSWLELNFRSAAITDKHTKAHLFPAHRLFIWAYEKALREECGYTGYQPVSLQ